MKIFKGRVVSMNKKNTVTVVVDSMKVHRLYKKRFIRSKKYHVHDEIGCVVGQIVNFAASKPYSRMVKWEVVGLASNDPTKGKSGRTSGSSPRKSTRVSRKEKKT